MNRRSVRGALQPCRDRSRARSLSGLKGRIAEAFVEAIFRRAGYLVSRAGDDRAGPGPADFLVRRPVQRVSDAEAPLAAMAIGVEYQRDVAAFLGEHARRSIQPAAPTRPELRIVVVTDAPDEGRSCFQLVEPSGVLTVDLHEVAELDIYPTTVREHEALVKQVFTLLEWHGQLEWAAPLVAPRRGRRTSASRAAMGWPDSAS